MYPSCGIGCWLLYKGREGWLRNSELFGFKGSCSEDWLLKLPSNTASWLQDIVPTVVEASCTLDLLSSGLNWGSSLGRFFGFAPGCLAWCFSSEVTAPQVTTNKGNMPVSFQSNQRFQSMGTKYNACFYGKDCKFNCRPQGCMSETCPVTELKFTFSIYFYIWEQHQNSRFNAMILIT